MIPTLVGNIDPLVSFPNYVLILPDQAEKEEPMTAAMTALATGSDQVRGATLAFPSLFFVGLILFIFTLALNLVADRFVRSVRIRY